MLEDNRNVQLHYQASDTETAGTRRMKRHENLPLYAKGMKLPSKDMPYLIFLPYQCEGRSKHRENLVCVEN
jgi:hypothetical protein